VSNTAAAKTVRELFDIKGRVAIVSGGSMGLGRQMAQALYVTFEKSNFTSGIPTLGQIITCPRTKSEHYIND
jgi:hypothetical protein